MVPAKVWLTARWCRVLSAATAGLDPKQAVRDVLVPEGGDTVFVQGQPMHVASICSALPFRKMLSTCGQQQTVVHLTGAANASKCVALQRTRITHAGVTTGFF